ncbi:MAG: hypothetical protein WEG36_00190 [Gemmatimonadota bacterium]
MRALTMQEMEALPGSGDFLRTTCGVTVGATVAASFVFGLPGFLLTVNKAITACGLAVLA